MKKKSNKNNYYPNNKRSCLKCRRLICDHGFRMIEKKLPGLILGMVPSRRTLVGLLRKQRIEGF